MSTVLDMCFEIKKYDSQCNLYMSTRNALVIFAFFLNVFTSSSQTKRTFAFSDTLFKVRQYHRLSIIYKLGRPELDSVNKATIDSIVHFLKINKNVAIEIAVHGKSTGCMAITQARSQSIADTLIALGIQKERLSPKGYGETRPLIPESEIKKAATKEEKAALISRNRRTELIIQTTDFGR